jgi:hypothetical protein
MNASLSLLVFFALHACASLRTPPWLAKYNAALDATFESAIPASVIQPELVVEEVSNPSNPSTDSARTKSRRRPQRTTMRPQRTTTRRTKSKPTCAFDRWDSESDAALLPGLVDKQPLSERSDEVSTTDALDTKALSPTRPERAAVWLASTYERLLRSSER